MAIKEQFKGFYKNIRLTQAQVREYKKQIDQLVYKLYGPTPEEIEVIEQSNHE